jgi:hypothetical protein
MKNHEPNAVIKVAIADDQLFSVPALKHPSKAAKTFKW